MPGSAQKAPLERDHFYYEYIHPERVKYGSLSLKINQISPQKFNMGDGLKGADVNSKMFNSQSWFVCRDAGMGPRIRKGHGHGIFISEFCSIV